MTQWGKNDNAANSVLWAAAQLNKPANTYFRTNLYQNTTIGVFETNEINGQYGLDAAEKVTAGNAAAQHAGWVLKTTGTGGVKSITLVSGGTGINSAGFLSITGGGGTGANASYTIANSQNTLQSYSTNPAWNVVNSVTLVTPGSGYTGAANIVYVGANTTRPVISLTMGDRVGRVQMETLVAMGSIV